MKRRTFGLLALAWPLCLSLNARAANLVVTNLADSGAGSLREAVAMANTNADADVITFDPAFDGQSISLSGSELMLSNTVTIDASALSNGIAVTVASSPLSAALPGQRIFEVAYGAVVELDNLTIRGGAAVDYSAGQPDDQIDYLPAEGGGILVDGGPGTLTLNHCTLFGNYAQWSGGAICLAANGFTLTLNQCTISRNIAALGGGIFCRAANTVVINNSILSGNAAFIRGGGTYGQVVLNGSTLYDNYALIAGGGSYGGSGLAVNNSTYHGNSAGYGGGTFDSSGQLTANNSTVSGNVAYTTAGGVGGHLAAARLTNSIVAGNSAPTNSNIGGNWLSLVAENNLTNGSALLAPLGDYGGPTPTMPPLAGSPAIDAGLDTVTNFLTTDERGYPRLSGAHVDIGAVELQGAGATNAPVLKLTFTSSPGADFTVLASTNVALPSSLWTPLGLALQSTPGEYQFTDPGATDYPQRFYQVVSP
jgi:hypothetical protein